MGGHVHGRTAGDAACLEAGLARSQAMADIDQAQLLQASKRLTDRREVHLQVGRERPLRRQTLARGVATRENRLAQPLKDSVRD